MRSVGLVGVVDGLQAQGRAGLDHLVAQGLGAPGRGDPQRTSRAAGAGRAERVVLDGEEGGEKGVPAPAGVAQPFQFVVVVPVAAVVDHPVDGAGPAEGAAARPDLVPSRRPERAGGVPPGGARVVHEPAEALGHGEHQPPVRPARLDEQHADAGVRRQLVGEDASGRTRADDEIIEHGDCLLHPARRSPGFSGLTLSRRLTVRPAERRTPLAAGHRITVRGGAVRPPGSGRPGGRGTPRGRPAPGWCAGRPASRRGCGAAPSGWRWRGGR
jgi:hypothetical protein